MRNFKKPGDIMKHNKLYSQPQLTTADYPETDT